MTIQTRSEENGLHNFDTLKEALDNADQDASVWKISFDGPDGSRVRLVAAPAEDEEGNEVSCWVFQALLTEADLLLEDAEPAFSSEN